MSLTGIRGAEGDGEHVAEDRAARADLVDGQFCNTLAIHSPSLRGLAASMIRAKGYLRYSPLGNVAGSARRTASEVVGSESEKAGWPMSLKPSLSV